MLSHGKTSSGIISHEISTQVDLNESPEVLSPSRGAFGLGRGGKKFGLQG